MLSPAPGAPGGSLYIVSTPIGNLADITYRAVQTLGKVFLIAAEDTRRTRILLDHYGIKTPLSSYNSFNKETKGAEFVRLMRAGKDLALVSDAGTPGISDPLYHLAREAVREGLSIYSLPGPVAAVAALTVSGLPTARFVFEGFLPRKKRRTRHLENLALEERTIILYESPQRVDKTLRELLQVFGDRKVAVARELTKMHEEVIRGTLAELVATESGRKWKGEITLVIAGREWNG